MLDRTERINRINGLTVEDVQRFDEDQKNKLSEAVEKAWNQRYNGALYIGILLGSCMLAVPAPFVAHSLGNLGVMQSAVVFNVTLDVAGISLYCLLQLYIHHIKNQSAENQLTMYQNLIRSDNSLCESQQSKDFFDTLGATTGVQSQVENDGIVSGEGSINSVNKDEEASLTTTPLVQ